MVSYKVLRFLAFLLVAGTSPQETAAQLTEEQKKPCSDTSKARYVPGMCGNDPYRPLPSVWKNAPRHCRTDPKASCIMGPTIICLCEDGAYESNNGDDFRMSYNVTARSMSGQAKRRLSSTKWFDVVITNQESDTMGFYSELRPIGPGGWSSSPWFYGLSADIEHEIDVPVTKGYRTTDKTERGRSSDWWSNIYLGAATEAQFDFRIMQAREAFGVGTNTVSIQMFTQEANNIVLNNPQSICDSPVTNLGISTTPLDWLAVDVGAALDPCSTNYISCGGQSSYGNNYKLVACGMEFAHRTFRTNRYFEAGVELK